MGEISPFGGITFAEASANLAANLSALSCPTGHANTVPIELAATGEKVAALCLDCDRQLPTEWNTSP